MFCECETVYDNLNENLVTAFSSIAAFLVRLARDPGSTICASDKQPRWRAAHAARPTTPTAPAGG